MQLSNAKSSDSTNDITGFVFVSVPPPRGEKYAFSVPVSGLYSILVYPVSERVYVLWYTPWSAERSDPVIAESYSLARIRDIQVSTQLRYRIDSFPA